MPGKKRKGTSKAPATRKKPSLTDNDAPGRPRKYKQWCEESMLGALKAVSEGAMGVNRAATEFGVPRTTLKDRVSGRVTHGSQPGRKPYLTNAEEKELHEYLIVCASIGYPKTRDDVIGIGPSKTNLVVLLKTSGGRVGGSDSCSGGLT